MDLNITKLDVMAAALTGFLGAYWFESGQTIWHWGSFLFTAVFITSMSLLLTWSLPKIIRFFGHRTSS
jgi:glycopeptide antibiotics resistance protein